MIVWLPHLKNEKTCYSIEKQKKFSGPQLLKNVEWLKASIGLDDSFVSYVNQLVQEWRENVKNIPESPWINETLTEKIDLEGNYAQEKEYGDCQRIVMENLEKLMLQKVGNLLLLSDSHATTEIVLKSYKELNPIPRIGVVCFDAHADLYDSGGIPWKGNIFSTLLEKEIVSSVLFIGVPMFRQRYLTDILSQRTKDKISFLDWRGTKDEIESALLKWNNPLPTNIFYSFDVDGLDSRKKKYTAMEYCSFHVLTALAEKDLTLETDIDKLRSILRDCIMQPIESLNDPKVIVRKNLFEIGDEGVPLKKIAKIVQRIEMYANMNSIQIGLPLNQNNLLVGDIVELFGPDFEGRTAKAAAEVIDILMNGRQLNKLHRTINMRNL